MSATSRRRGKTWERDIRDYLRDQGYDYEQLRQTGAHDEGDGVIRLPNGAALVIEAKNTAQIAPGPHLTEATAEAKVYARNRKRRDGSTFGAVLQKRRQSRTGKSYVFMELDDFLALLHATRE